MKKAFLQLHSAIILAACSSIFGNLIELDAVLITWYRMLIAAIMLLAIRATGRRGTALTHSDWKVLATGALLALHWTMFYGSIKYANVSVGVVCFCLSGFFTAIISPFVNHRHISWMELSLSSLTLVGISLIFHFDSSFRTGIMFGVVSALLFAIYATLNGRVNASDNASRITMLQMTGGVIGLGALLPVYLYWQPSVTIVPSWTDFGYLFLLALGCTVCMCSLLNWAQRSISAFTVSLSFNLEPVYSIVLAIVLFHEEKILGAAFYAGLSLIVLSLLLQMAHIIHTARTSGDH